MRNVKLIIVFIIGFILTIGIGSAYKLNASEVTYDKKNTTLESNTVSGAVNELGVLATTSMSEVKSMLSEMSTKINSIYDNLGNIGKDEPTLHIVTIASSSNSYIQRTFDITSIENYQDLTWDNFAVKVSGLSRYSDGTHFGNPNGFSYTYNQEQGILTVSQSGCEVSGQNFYFNYSVVVYY